jgi:hypothetical protein
MLWPIVNLPDSQGGAPLEISVLRGSARFAATPRFITLFKNNIQLRTHLATVTNLSNTVLHCKDRIPKI